MKRCCVTGVQVSNLLCTSNIALTAEINVKTCSGRAQAARRGCAFSAESVHVRSWTLLLGLTPEQPGNPGDGLSSIDIDISPSMITFTRKGRLRQVR